MNIVTVFFLVITTLNVDDEPVKLQRAYETKEQCEFVKDNLKQVTPVDKFYCEEVNLILGE